MTGCSFQLSIFNCQLSIVLINSSHFTFCCLPVITLTGKNSEKIAVLKDLFQQTETGQKGVEEIRFILDWIEHLPLTATVELDLTLARGLSYYTGAIFEVKALDAEMGSIVGGGRYDNLTGVFGMSGLSGVGISFGADRIFDVLNQLELYPDDTQQTTQLMFVNFGEKEVQYLLPFIHQIRQKGISTEIYPDPAKMKKQMSYADAKKIPFVVLVGENEIAEQTVQLKDMTTGEQRKVTWEELAKSMK
jgi:histidyl-tRNA synthetase